MDEIAVVLILLLLGWRKKGDEPTGDDDCLSGQHRDPESGLCVDDAIVIPGVVVDPDEPEDEPAIADIVLPGDDPDDVDELIKLYPTPASFYQVKSGDMFKGNQGIATRLARTALYLAATEVGKLDQAAANTWAGAVANKSAVRNAVTDLISCTPINDWRYGTWAYTVGVARPGPHGRAIRLLKIHFSDRARLKVGDSFSRNIRLGKPGDAPSVSQSGVQPGTHSYELLWLPGVNLQKLWESDGGVWEPGGEWSDGSSKVHPPPALLARGVQDFTSAGDGPWGCAPYAVEGE